MQCNVLYDSMYVDMLVCVVCIFVCLLNQQQGLFSGGSLPRARGSPAACLVVATCSGLESSVKDGLDGASISL